MGDGPWRRWPPWSPLKIVGCRRPGEANLAFGRMNETLWKRLPTPPGERIGRRARVCVCACVFRIRSRRGPGRGCLTAPSRSRPHVARQPGSARGGWSGGYRLKAGARGLAVGSWTSAPGVRRFEKEAIKAGAEPSFPAPSPVFPFPEALRCIHVG